MTIKLEVWCLVQNRQKFELCKTVRRICQNCRNWHSCLFNEYKNILNGRKCFEWLYNYQYQAKKRILANLRWLTISVYCCICRTAASSKVCIFLRHFILASTFSLSDPSRFRSSSSVSPDRSAEGMGGGIAAKEEYIMSREKSGEALLWEWFIISKIHEMLGNERHVWHHWTPSEKYLTFHKLCRKQYLAALK